MDDSTKNPIIQDLNQPIVQDDNQIPVQPPVTQPVSVASKEAPRPVSDYLSVSEAPIVVEQELKEVGVGQVVQSPKLDDEHKQVGIEHSLENNIPKTEALGFVKLPLTDEEIKTAEKDEDANSSIFWLAMLITKIKRTIFWKK